VRREPVSLIVSALQELCEQQGVKIPGCLGGETSLFGQDGLLDSLGLVSLVIAVEQAIADEFGVHVSLADEKAMSQKHSPYRTIGALVEYASRLIHAETKDG
jgi:acyl carrier protein